MIDRISDLEERIQGLHAVVAAVADDTLRVCVLLQELSNSGVLPVLPWRLATTIVELHHAQLASEQGEVPGTKGVKIQDRLEDLKSQIATLRKEWENRNATE